METRFQLRVVLGAAILLVGVFSFISTARADKAGNAAKAAEAAVAKAEELKERCRELTAVNEQAHFDLDQANARLKEAAGTDQEAARAKEQKAALKKAYDAMGAANEKCGDARKALEDADALIKAAEKALKEKTDRGGKDDEGLGGEDGKLDKLKKRSDALKPKKQESIAPPSAGQTTESKTGNGLRTITFDIPPGRVTVNLPDDMMAGDTISGTVIAEPKGKTQQEREKNRGELEGLVFEIKDFSFGVENPTTIRPAIGGANVDRIPISNNQLFSLSIPPVTSRTPADKIVVRFLLVDPTSNNATPPMFEIKDFSFEVVNRTTIGSATGAGKPTVSDFKIPKLGQQGRPIEIFGPFDGNFDNTTVQVGDQKTVPLAGSPREIVVQSPRDVVGPTQITVKEGNKETKGEYRNLKVELTAPKTTLLKGDQTELQVEVQGLKGITQPVPLHLTNGGAVTMTGGNSQTMSIKPSDVQSNGSYMTTRTITGVQTGGWIATATVVNFNTCLEDDGDPLRVLLFNVATGDFSFCQGRGESTGQKPIEISTFPFGNDFTGGVRVQAGDGIDSPMKPGATSIGPGASLIKNGTFTSADFNYTRAQIHVELNGYSRTGSATVQTTNPKQAFTITDRDTRNNTCACK